MIVRTGPQQWSVSELVRRIKSSGGLGHKSIGCSAPRLERSSTEGKASLGWTVLVALATIVALIWLLIPDQDPIASDPQLPPPGPSARTEVAASENSATTSRTAMTIQPALEVGRSETLTRAAPQPFDDSRLDGRGHICGHVQAPPGIEFPQEWVLSVEPSSSLIGRERAETRRLEFHAGEQDFDLPDLALGGYMLRASAYGLSSGEQHLLLARPAETDLYVLMQLAVTAFVEGAVRYEDSSPAIGLELALEPRPAGVRITATSDALGHFLFTDVKSGGYTLYFGRPENPVRESIEVNVSGSAERLADTIVPRMCELIVRVLLERGVPAAGVKVDGYGDHGGRFAGVTDAEGEFRARFLPPGRITVNASFADGGRVLGRQLVSVGVLGLIELVRSK